MQPQKLASPFTDSELATAREELRYFVGRDRVTSAGLWSNGKAYVLLRCANGRLVAMDEAGTLRPIMTLNDGSGPLAIADD
jgi:hypothetical protein